MEIVLTKEKVEADLENGLSIGKLVKKYSSTRPKIRYFMKKNGLKSKVPSFSEGYNKQKECTANVVIEGVIYDIQCTDCKTLKPCTDFYIRKKRNTYKTVCTECEIEYNVKLLKRKRKNIKQTLINLKGGKCECCGYNKSIWALEFHHRDPTKKEFGLGNVGNKKEIEKQKKEVEKCFLLCSNCHRETHYGLHPEYLDEVVKEIEKGDVVCTTCGGEFTKDNYSGHNKQCNQCIAKHVREYYRSIKLECVNYLGGKCEKCNYSTSQCAMDFHHRDPGEKDFQISKHLKKFGNSHKKELDKCMLLCSNCHRETHEQLNLEEVENEDH